MPYTLAELKSELTNDPIAYGYAPFMAVRDVDTLYEMINRVRDGTNGGPAIIIRKANLSIKELYEAVVMSDMPALSGSPNAAALSTERQRLAWFTGLASLDTVRILNDDGSNNSVADNLLAMFPVGSGTRTRLIALAQRFGSRGEQLWGEGVHVAFMDIAFAHDLP